MFTDQSGNLRTLLPAVLPNVTGRRKSLDQRFRAKDKLDEGRGAEGSGLCCDGKETKDEKNQRFYNNADSSSKTSSTFYISLFSFLNLKISLFSNNVYQNALI